MGVEYFARKSKASKTRVKSARTYERRQAKALTKQAQLLILAKKKLLLAI